jgi:hypothetical protein
MQKAALALVSAFLVAASTVQVAAMAGSYAQMHPARVPANQQFRNASVARPFVEHRNRSGGSVCHAILAPAGH